MRFRADQHLRRQLDFQHIRKQGRRYDCGAFVFWFVRQAAKEPKKSRIAFIASRAAVGNAVRRTRAKRRLREVFRLNQKSIPSQGYDFMLVARAKLNLLDYHEIEARFLAACKNIFSEKQI